MNPAPELLLRQQPEPSLDQVEPRRTRRREVHVIARTLRQPTMDQCRLVNGRVVQDEMDIQLGGYRGVDGIEEAAELPTGDVFDSGQ